MRLALNVGNTNTVVALFDDKTVFRVGSVPTATMDTVFRAAQFLDCVWRASGLLDGPEGSIIASVVPGVTDLLAEALKDLSGFPPRIVDHEMDLGIILAVERPEEVGADRLVNAAEAYALHGKATVVVDLGTATTFEVVDEEGRFLGGAIAPGIETGRAALSAGTEQLFEPNLQFPIGVIGRSTEEAIRSGLLWGSVSLIEGMLDRYREEIGECLVIVTGGLGGLIKHHLSGADYYEPDLTLTGLKRLDERNR